MIVFENDDVVVINKPCGVPSQMGSQIDPNKTPSIDWLAKAYLSNNDQDPYLVHRLDKSTSGLMCLAKNRDMARLLSAEMMQRNIQKEYMAIVCNFSKFFPFPSQGVIRQSITHPEDLWSVQDTLGGEEG